MTTCGCLSGGLERTPLAVPARSPNSMKTTGTSLCGIWRVSLRYFNDREWVKVSPDFSSMKEYRGGSSCRQLLLGSAICTDQTRVCIQVRPGRGMVWKHKK